MANWALVTYKCECRDRQQAEAFIKLLDELKSLPKPYAESDFGNLWMGCVVKALGGDPDEIKCRGKIFDDYNIDGNVVTLVTEQAWSEQEKFRYLVERMYPGMKIWYCSEESNEGVYCTNDAERKFFKSWYYLDYEDGGEYFDTIEQAAEFVSDKVGMPVEPTIESIEDEIEKYQEDNDWSDESWMSFHVFKIVED